MRSLGMWQQVFRLAAQRADETPPPQRGVVTGDDATSALLHAAIVVDAAIQTQNGQLTRDQALHIMSMLMVARDYVRPLPVGQADPEGPDLVTADLQELVDAIRLGPYEIELGEG